MGWGCFLGGDTVAGCVTVPQISSNTSTPVNKCLRQHIFVTPNSSNTFPCTDFIWSSGTSNNARTSSIKGSSEVRVVARLVWLGWSVAPGGVSFGDGGVVVWAVWVSCV